MIQFLHKLSPCTTSNKIPIATINYLKNTLLVNLFSFPPPPRWLLIQWWGAISIGKHHHPKPPYFSTTMIALNPVALPSYLSSEHALEPKLPSSSQFNMSLSSFPYITSHTTTLNWAWVQLIPQYVLDQPNVSTSNKKPQEATILFDPTIHPLPITFFIKGFSTSSHSLSPPRCPSLTTTTLLITSRGRECMWATWASMCPHLQLLTIMQLMFTRIRGSSSSS